MSAMCDIEVDNDNTDNQNSNPKKMNSIEELDIKNLLENFSKKNYSVVTEESEETSILERCEKLLEIDYNVVKISNAGGELCPQYPSQLLLAEYENRSIPNKNGSGSSTQRTTGTIYETIDLLKIREHFNRAKYARCRMRFPIPTILFRGKYVCRSATLSDGKELYGRSGLDYLFAGNVDANSEVVENVDSEPKSEKSDSENTLTKWKLFDKIRGQDIKLLKRLNIGTIVDLMVENRKVKYLMTWSSSEKVDDNRYTDFNIMSVPFPGCEFFKEFKDNNYLAEGLIFNWSQEMCDADISVPENPLLKHLKIDWSCYKQWDLVHMTQNYIRYLLKYLQVSTSGVLIHCISGWDRTPLFISLLRLSLWADGLIHQGLDEKQILYFTIAYDWMLFGHCLSNRLKKGEEIFFFCFHMLKYLTDQEFSIASKRSAIHKKCVEKTEDGTVKTEDDPMGADLLLEEDQFRGSNASLNSIGSSISNKSQDTTLCQNNDETNGNASVPMSLDVPDTLALGASASPLARRTSPVTVPIGARLRRTDSSTTTSSVLSTTSNSSSNSSGSSWHVVTTTGSLKGSDSSSTCGDIPFADTSVCSIVDNEISPEYAAFLKGRADKLVLVRDTFYKAYFATIGKDIKIYPEPSIASKIYSAVEATLFPKEQSNDSQ